MTHTSGLSYDAIPGRNLEKYVLQAGKTPNSGSTVFTKYDYPLISQPGEAWEYGVGMDFAGKALEQVHGKSLEEIYNEGIYKPLGLQRTSFWVHKKDNPLSSSLTTLTMRGADGKLGPMPGPLNEEHEEPLGGAGGHAATSDYIQVLKSLLANDEKLLKKETADFLFTPQLDDKQRASFKAYREGPVGPMFIGEYVKSIECDFGIGNTIFLSDDVGRRKKGTIGWGGVTNTYWIVDREADLALAFGTSVLPPGDPATRDVITAVEHAVYKYKEVGKA